MKTKNLPLLQPALILLLSQQLALQTLVSDPMKCNEPEYFGICNPYVPGILIKNSGDRQPIPVLGTWPDGPAETAGICPGDRIVAVNGVSALDTAVERLLRELIADSPTPVVLKVLRGTKEIEFRTRRVRESTLAKRSKQKFLRHQLVPLNQTLQGLEELDRFRKGIDARYGLKQPIEGVWVPAEMQEMQVQYFLDLITRAKKSKRLLGAIPVFQTKNDYSPGFSAVLLKDPEEIRVFQVFPHSPSHRAGLFPGDEILQVDGRRLASLAQDNLVDLLLKSKQSTQLLLKIRRMDSSEFSLKVETQKAEEFVPSTLDAYTGESRFHEVLPEMQRRSSHDYILGLQALYAESPKEAIAAGVEYPSPAFDAGLHVGDLFASLNDTPIAHISREQFEEILKPKGDSSVAITVWRVGRQLRFRIKPVPYGQALAKIGRKLTQDGPSPKHCGDG